MSRNCQTARDHRHRENDLACWEQYLQWAQALGRRPYPAPNETSAESAQQRDLLEFVASFTTGVVFSPTDAQELEEFLAAVSTRHARLAYDVTASWCDDPALSEAEWDPAKHPRQGGPPNAGWFASSGDGSASAKPPREHDQLAQLQSPPAVANPAPRPTFDAAVVKQAGIVVRRHPGQPTHAPSVDGRDQGGASWTIPWEGTVDPSLLPFNNHGWLVQHVTVEPDVRDAAGNEVTAMKRAANGDPDPLSGRTKNIQDSYLEAWRVDVGVGLNKDSQVRGGEDPKLKGEDTFQVAPEQPGTYGRVVIRGRAVFIPKSKGYPNLDQGRWNRPSQGGHKKDPTYILPSTRDAQELKEFGKHAGSAADHWMVYEWDTRDPDPAKHIHIRYGGLGVPPPVLPPIPKP